MQTKWAGGNSRNNKIKNIRAGSSWQSNFFYREMTEETKADFVVDQGDCIYDIFLVLYF